MSQNKNLKKEENHQTRDLKRIKKLLESIEQEYSCSFPKGFDEKLFKCAADTNYPTMKTVRGIVDEWKYWKPYVSEDSFINFMCCGLEDMFRIHCTATSYVPGSNSYIGLKVKRVKNVPVGMSSYVTFTGTACSDGKPIWD